MSQPNWAIVVLLESALTQKALLNQLGVCNANQPYLATSLGKNGQEKVTKWKMRRKNRADRQTIRSFTLK
jgi:hypothetical protein